MRRIALAALLPLAACGQQQSIKPAPGMPLPLKAATAPAAQTPTELLKPPAHIRPTRSDELLTKSQPRPDDPFDQPPR